jgi:WD40 repeat protein
MINIKEKNDIILNIEISKDSYVYTDLDNIFITFLSYSGILTLIYPTKIKSIISYDLNNFQIITEIKNAHKGEFITNFNHFFDKYKKIDLILSISGINRVINIWNNKNWELILTLENIYNSGRINSACFVQNELDNNTFIVTSNNFFSSPENIKIFNLEGKHINEIENSNENVYYINTLVDNKKIYIIVCSYNYLISYDYGQNKFYKKYHSPNSKIHYSFDIIKENTRIKLISSSMDGAINIWDFHSSELLHKFIASNNPLYSISLLNKSIILISSNNGIIVFNIDTGKKIKTIYGFNNWICCIKLIEHKKYGKCFISQGIKNEQIKLMKIKDLI